ncbi:Hypothetical predicted protein [Cloeon dipterum]|uniref:Uncharacterized protein n=1 Tax=Cloeon dipterum TaxID=197152 RepID=A0A8S1C3D0_9INSE|nr:Hypothetical predicted protein [Cloeon dipterum]
MTRNKDVDIFVARAWHEGELLPGYVWDDLGYFCYKGNMISKPLTRCQILVSHQVGFAEPYQCEPKDCLPVGCDAGKKHLYMGIFLVNGVQLCGEVRDGVCNIAGRNGRVWTEPNYFWIVTRLWEPFWDNPTNGPPILQCGKLYRQKKPSS